MFFNLLSQMLESPRAHPIYSARNTGQPSIKLGFLRIPVGSSLVEFC